MDRKVLIVDAGLGNIGSVKAAFERITRYVDVIQDPSLISDVEDYSHMILPGVGTFHAGMNRLRKRGWESFLKDEWLPLEKNLLGICLGMQLLATLGEEGGREGEVIKGLGVVPGNVKRMEGSYDARLPHMGWNSARYMGDNKEWYALRAEVEYYFVHSYEFLPDEDEDILATSIHGRQFVSAVKRGRIVGVQFHPEKSQRAGKYFLERFLEEESC